MPGHATEALTNRIREVEVYVEEGSLFVASSKLTEALKEINRRTSSKFEGILPANVRGWDRENLLRSESVGAFSDGIHVSAIYKHERGSRIRISIAAQTPLLRSTIQMLQNPLFLEASGYTMENIHGWDMLVDYNQADQSGVLRAVIQESVLVSIQGWDVELANLHDLAGQIDFAEISRIVLPKK